MKRSTIAALLAGVSVVCLVGNASALSPTTARLVIEQGKVTLPTLATSSRLILPDSSTTNKSVNAVSGHVAETLMTGRVVICIGNFTIANAAVPAETAVGGTMNVAASIEYPLGATPTSVTFNGLRQSGAISTASLCSDPSPTLPAPIPPLAQYLVHIWESNSAGFAFSSVRDSSQDTTFASATALTDLTTTAGQITNNLSTQSVQPMVIAAPWKGPAVAIVGTSIDLGVKTTWNGVTLRNGIVAPGISSTIPALNLASSGEQCALWSSNAPIRNSLIKYFNIVDNGLGTNDVHVAGSSAATLATCQATLISNFPGKPRVILNTILAETASTTGWTDTGNQTADTAQSIITTYNNLVKAGSIGGNNWGYFDYVPYIQTSGLWNIAATARGASDCAISSTVSPTHLSSSSLAFTSADIGTGVWVQGAGVSGADLGTNSNAATVASISSGTVAVLNTGANTTVSSAACRVGSIVNDGIHPNDAGDTIVKNSGAIDNTKFVAGH